MIKLFSCFTGIGAWEKSLQRLNIPYELVGFSEVDKYAIKSYCSIHNVDEKLNYGDISKINEKELPDFDLMTFSFPCQAFSLAGKRLGFDDMRGTLVFDAMRIIKEKQPKYWLFENVAGLLSHDGGRTIEIILENLSKLGYEITMDMLNSKDYSIPQNRSRIFCLR